MPFNDDDKLLIEQIKDKDERAFELFYNKYSGKVYNFVLSITYNPNLAEDITQNCFLTIWEKAKHIDGDKNIKNYVFTIARNFAFKELKKQLLTHEFTDADDREFDDYILEKLNVKYLEAHINKLLETLPVIAQNIYRLRKEKGWSSKEIADSLSLSERSVEAHLYRTFKHLRSHLKDYFILLLIGANL